MGALPGVPATIPGAMPLVRMPNSPHSNAKDRVKESTADLAALACACRFLKAYECKFSMIAIKT